MNEMTIHSLAGFCNEKALWKLLVDMSSTLLNETSKNRKVITPEMVMIEGEHFRLIDETPQNPSTEFYPPEGIDNSGSEGFVWSLAALVCYASSGHYVFGGRGGSYQRSHPKVELPTLKKDHSALTNIIKRCLCYSPSQRISLKELNTIAIKGLESKERMSRVIRMIESNDTTILPECPDSTWPERME